MCGVLSGFHIWKYRCITCVANTCVKHMFYKCKICVGYTPVLHMYFYICNTGVEYTHVLHVSNMYITGVYRCITGVCITFVIHLNTQHVLRDCVSQCDTHVAHLLVC